MDRADARVDEHVKYVLRVVSAFVGLACVYGPDIVEAAFYENFICLGSLSHRHQILVNFLSPVEIRLDDILVLVERAADDQKLEKFEQKLLPLRLVKQTIMLALLNKQTFPNLIANLNLLIILRHHLRNVAFLYDF